MAQDFENQVMVGAPFAETKLPAGILETIAERFPGHSQDTLVVIDIAKDRNKTTRYLQSLISGGILDALSIIVPKSYLERPAGPSGSPKPSSELDESGDNGPQRAIWAVFSGSHSGTGHPGVLHGGLLASLFDELYGSLFFFSRIPAFTANLSVDYRRTIPVGMPVLVTLEVRQGEGRKMHGVAKMERATDFVLLSESSTLFIKAK